jgi:3-oxoacyl-[acyl-carrier-protein] synthase II
VTISGAVKLPEHQSERFMLKNAFGFGGHNISLILAAVSNKA